MGLKGRLAHAWNAFLTLDKNRDPTFSSSVAAYGTRPDRTRLRYTSDKSIISAIFTRIAIDASSLVIKHVRLDDEDRFAEEIDSGLNGCLKLEANIDQAATAFRRDWIMTLFDKGVVAAVPIDTTINPSLSSSYDIKTMRVGEIVQWMPDEVRVSVYNEATGRREDINMGKRWVAIVENPFYNVMNEPSSTLQRLIRKLNMLDAVDEASSSGKLDLIIQLPYVVKGEVKREQAEQRRKDIEYQLKGSKYGIAYTDGTEKITQLNRPSENNLLKQVEYLTELLYSQLGLTKKVMDGTADEAEMLNYHQRTIKPILNEMVEEMRRKFLTKTARSQGHSIMYFRDAFSLVPMEQVAELGDKLTRNEIVTSNEFRGFLGLKPVKDPKADTLRNSNMPEKDLGIEPSKTVKATSSRLDQQLALPAGRNADPPE